jgi:putative acetyltransferase
VFVLRRATPRDAARAAAIIRAALGEHALPFEPEGRDADVASFGARADNDDLVAEIEGEICGIVSVGPHGAPGVAWISKLFVARAHRRRGIGRALLAGAEEAARARGYRAVGLRTRTLFRDAVRLYEASGYRLVSVAESPGEVVYCRAL